MTTFKANRKFPNPITVTDDPKSHTLALQQIIEALNVGQRRTREIDSSYVRVHELVDVGLIEIVGNQLKLTNAGAAAVAAGASALADLTDVDLTGLADGDTLVWDSGAGMWVPGAASSGPITGADMYDVSLNDLADVAFSDPQDGDTLTYDAASGVWTLGEATYSPVDDGCTVTRQTAQALTASTFADLIFTAQERDDSGYWDPAAPTKITFPHSGWYVVSAYVRFDSTGYRDCAIQIQKNGSATATGTRIAFAFSNFNTGNSPTISEVRYFSRGDYITLGVYSTLSENVANLSPYAALSVHRLGVSQSQSSPQNDGAAVYRAASAQTVLSGTNLVVTFDTELRDDNNYFSLSANDRLTIPETGWYLLQGTVRFSANSSGSRYLFWAKNGDTGDRYGQTQHYPTASPTAHVAQSTAVLYLSRGDYVQLVCGQDSGSSLTVSIFNSGGEDSGQPRATIHRLGVPNTTVTQPVDDGAYVTLTTDQSITGGSHQSIPFATEVRDDNGYWSSANPNRFTIPAGCAGWYAINLYAHWDTSNYNRGLWISKNGSAATGANVISGTYQAARPGTRQEVSAVAYLNAGDYVLLEAFTDTTSSILGSTGSPAHASIHRLGASSSPGNPRNDGGWVYRAATPPSIAHATLTTLTFDTEVRDDGSYANLAANNDRIVIPRAGWYSIFGAFQWDAIGTGFICSGYIDVNGSTVIQQLLPSVNNLTNHMSGLLYLNAGDVVKLQAYQTSGVSKSLICSGGMPTLRVHRLGVPESVETVNDQFFDAASRFEHYDDFISRDNVGDQGYGTGTANGGSVTQGSLNKHPGIISCATSANNAGYGILNLSPAGGSIFSAEQLFFTPTGTDELYFEALIRVNALFNASPNPGAYRIGFIDQVTSYGQYAYCDFGNGGAVFGTKGSGGSQSGNFSTNLTANTWHRLKIKLTATSAQAYLDDVLQVTHTDATKFATAGFTAFFFVQNQGGTGVNHVLDVDYVRIWGTSTRN